MKIPFVKSKFTKVIQPNRFDYTPRYYDPVKADLDERVRELKRQYEKESNQQPAESAEESKFDQTKELEMRIKFQKRIEQSRTTGGVMSSGVRFIIILVLVLTLGYFLFTNLDGILRVLLK